MSFSAIKLKAFLVSGLGLLLQAGTSPSFAAPVGYSFTTGATAYVGAVNGAPFIPVCALCGGASGTFSYDSEAPLGGTNANGSFTYFGFTPSSVNGMPSSITSLSAQAGGFGFSDPNGSTIVANDTFTGFGSAANVDALILAFDPVPQQGDLFPRNFSGFEIEGFRLVTARMLWIESLAMTNELGPPNEGTPTADFLGNQNLPATPPSFAGRLWLDFQSTTDPSITSFVFFNNLQVTAAVTPVPEPETYAMLLAGLGLLAFKARRRRKLGGGC